MSHSPIAKELCLTSREYTAPYKGTHLSEKFTFLANINANNSDRVKLFLS